jgi:hypothetical protein
MKREIRTGQKLRWALSRLGGGDGESRWKNDQTPNKCIFGLLSESYIFMQANSLAFFEIVLF